MNSESWIWWTTDPWLRRLHVLLGMLGLALVVGLTVVLLTPDDSGVAPVRFEQAKRCLGSSMLVEYRRVGLARVLRAPLDSSVMCDEQVVLPAHQQGVPTPEQPALERVLGHARFHVSYVVPPDWPMGQHLFIYVPRVMASAWQVSVNGQPVADNLDDWRMTWNTPVAATYTAFQVGQVLDITVDVAYLPQMGYTMSRVSVGPSSRVGRSLAMYRYLSSTMPQACSIGLLLLGAFFFAFWLVRQQETVHLLLALASVAWCICNLQYVLPRHDDPMLEGWYSGIVNMSVAWYMWLLYLFALRFDHRRMRWVEWILPLHVLVMSVLALPVLGISPDAFGIWFQAMNAAMAGGVTLLIGVRAVAGGGIELRVIALALWVALIAGMHDVALLAQAVDPEGIYWLPYGGLLVFCSFLFALQRRYVSAINEHEALSHSLAQRLAQREQELTQNHARLRELERAQTLAIERRRLMHDMHDGLGSALISSLAVAERGEVQLVEVASMLRECLDDLRIVIDSLEPVDNDLVTLLATLRFRLGRRLENAGIHIEWQMEELPQLEWMGPSEALQVMRVVQEVLSNVIKHAQAHKIRVHAYQHDGAVQVSVVDDGIGFDLSSPTSGRGLPLMKQRVTALGGVFSVESNVGTGTVVRLSLPIHKSH